MKLRNIINTLSLAAVALVVTACNDTDAQYSIPVVGAPEFTAVSPDVNSALIYGDKTIKVKFDKRIGFATKNTEKITLNGVPVKKALVLGADSVLTIYADVSFDKTQNLVIPAGLIVGPQGDVYDKELNFTWTIKDFPSNDATAMTKKLGWGWNLGNHFDTSNMQWGYWDGATPQPALFQKLAAAGAKTVRVPVTWSIHMIEGTNTLDPAYLNEVAGVVDMAIAAGLNVILNTHHDWFETDLGSAANQKLVAKSDSAAIANLWSQVATYFANYNDQLIFETFNEVHAGDDWGTGSDEQFKMLNKWNQYAVDAIRGSGGNNVTRWIGVSGYAANIDLTIKNLVLPTDPANHIMVGVHCYDPYDFCLAPVDEKADTLKVNSWGHNAIPGYSVDDKNEEYIINQLYKLRTAYIEKGIPCYLGEYGCVYQTTAPANAYRKYYLEYFCRSAYLAGIPMMVWDNTGNDALFTTGGNEVNYYINHNDGSFVADGADIVPLMIKACTNTDASYWFDAIWTHSPEPEK